MSKTVLITGGSRGIGFATAKQFSENSQTALKIVLVSRSEVELDEAAAKLALSAPAHVQIVTVSADLKHRDAVMELARVVHSTEGNIDFLINNAGYTKPTPLHQVDFSDFEETMAVNLYAPFTLVQELLHLGNRFECIVNVASTAGMNGRSGWLTYSASKAALINMSAVMKEELAIYGTRVVCVSPGRCATDLRRTLAPDEDPSTIMQPEHVAAAIHTLTSNVGRYLDSDNLVVRL